MTDPTPDIFSQTEAGLRGALDRLSATLDAADGADPPDKTARAISAILKSLADLDAHRDRIRTRDLAVQYTRYEDLPPPSPEDEARFHVMFQKLFDLVAATDPAQAALALDAEPPTELVRALLDPDGAARPDSN